MSHLYPLAATADDALACEEDNRARTRYEADALAGDGDVIGLETEWITPEGAALDAMLAALDAGRDMGFVQRYEDAAGAPVFAVTYWRLAQSEPQSPAPGTAAETAPEPEPKGDTPPADHTDELYFRKDRARPKRRKRRKPVDPRQLDLFSTGPDQAGYERPDPDNPDVILTDEEGDGTAFGLGPSNKKSD